jgi:hypothetical protein
MQSDNTFFEEEDNDFWWGKLMGKREKNFEAVANLILELCLSDEQTTRILEVDEDFVKKARAQLQGCLLARLEKAEKRLKNAYAELNGEQNSVDTSEKVVPITPAFHEKENEHLYNNGKKKGEEEKSRTIIKNLIMEFDLSDELAARMVDIDVEFA